MIRIEFELKCLLIAQLLKDFFTKVFLSSFIYLNHMFLELQRHFLLIFLWYKDQEIFSYASLTFDIVSFGNFPRQETSSQKSVGDEHFDSIMMKWFRSQIFFFLQLSNL